MRVLADGADRHRELLDALGATIQASAHLGFQVDGDIGDAGCVGVAAVGAGRAVGPADGLHVGASGLLGGEALADGNQRQGVVFAAPLLAHA